jgi:hypothetical protein
LLAAYHVVPDLQGLSVRIQAANYLAVPAGFVIWATAYALLYSMTALLTAMFIFSRRRAI